MSGPVVKASGTGLSSGFAGLENFFTYPLSLKRPKNVSSQIFKCRYLKNPNDNFNFTNIEAPNKFTIHSQQLNVSKLALAFDGPSKPDCKMTTQKDGTVDVCYTTQLAGDYKVHIKFEDKHIQGSPFSVKILGDVKAAVEKVKVTGAATKNGKNNANNEVIVDAREAGITSKSKTEILLKFV